ncbi:Cgl0159 family (beta/alpha)8-fold protein [Brevibacterium sp. UCMA 11754]|uniref:Cgl0159 family (beta/alpha)8-fold protein n=1 Tax=Brevibacterium sp. UCMA 11754 TaxID=2749198 RepID=UPI001F2A4FB6|nr:deoxyribose-phosphate aldolase [Brevibacterium sp. UCMA 11754]MCF2571702.1 deoxyribose-phosphate aldolase [Brevibacterium sp. UCMA 11754]
MTSIITPNTISELREIRFTDPAAIARAWQSRSRRTIVGEDSRLFIVAADHPARGAMKVGSDPLAMADRVDLVTRLAAALSRPGVDGVLATADILDDLAFLGHLENKLAVGSMNRGGLAGSNFEIDDRFTGHTVDQMARDGIDLAKSLLRINLGDPATASALEANANAVNACAAADLPIMIEPFMNEWADDRVRNQLTPEAVINSIGIAQGLGATSSHTWLKIPVVDDMEKVMAATTLPTLLLGGERSDDPEATFRSWENALALPGVRGLVTGRSIIYPADGDVVSAVDRAAGLVHAPERMFA